MNIMRRCLLLSLLVSCGLANPALGELVVINQDVTIDATNSYPEPTDNDSFLFVEVRDSSIGTPTHVQVNAGGVIGGMLDIYDHSSVTMNGGEFQDFTRVRDNSALTINSGSLLPKTRLMRVSDITGVLEIHDSATLNYFAGDVFGSIYQTGNSVINVYGYGFSVIGDLPFQPFQNGRVEITGFSTNGEPLNLSIRRRSSTAAVYVHLLPEPATLLLAACATFGVLCFCRRR
jgi:hypothetical protein